MTIIEAYAPTTEAEDEGAATFQGEALSVIDRTALNALLVIRDWNTKVGNIQKEQSVIELFGLGSKNSPGE